MVCLSLQATMACAGTFELLPSGATPLPTDDDPSTRLLAGPTRLAYDYRLAAPALGVGPETVSAGSTSHSAEVPLLRLQAPGLREGPLRFQRADVSLSVATGPAAIGPRQARAGAGPVGMDLREAKGPVSPMSFGSVLRFDMAQGAQVALRFKGGRLGLQYRVPFSL